MTVTGGAVVVGAGPTGVFVVGTLLDLGVPHITWLDRELDGAGRLKHYRAVPSNTKVRLFVRAALECESFRKVWDALRTKGAGKELARIEALDQDAECPLGYAASLLEELCAGLLQVFADRITPVPQYASRIECTGVGAWNVTAEDGRQVAQGASIVVVATGSQPVLPSQTVAGVKLIALDDALSPDRFAAALPPSSVTGDIAVIGSSHSAVLVVRNAVEVVNGAPESARARVKNFYRTPLKYAEYIDATTIINDNTGLKGIAAAWARRHLDDDAPEPLDSIVRILTTPATEPTIYEEELRSCCAAVYAIGYARNPLPEIIVNGRSVGDSAIDYDEDAQLTAGGAACKGLFGFGIAFPERLKLKDGSTENNVGLWKFIRYIREVLPRTVPGLLAHTQQ